MWLPSAKKKIMRKKISESFAADGAALDDDDDDGDANLHHREALQGGPQIPCTHCSSQPGQNLLCARFCKDMSTSTSFIKNTIFSSIWNCHRKCLTGCHCHQTDHQQHHGHHHHGQLRHHLERLAGCDHPVLRLHLPLPDQLLILILITSTFMMKLILLKMFILSSSSTN